MAPTQITFNEGGNSSAYTLSGWGKPESHGSWTDGVSSRLRIDGLRPGAAYALTVHLRPFLYPPELTHQDIRIAVNGTACAETRVTETGPIECTIPAGTIGPDGSAIVSLECPTATSPSQLGISADARRIGFSVWALAYADLGGPGSGAASQAPALPGVPKIGVNAAGRFFFRVAGHCPLCREDSEFVAERDKEIGADWFPHWFRGDLACTKCRSIPRQRALFAVLDMACPDWRNGTLHESSPGRDPSSRRLRADCAGYVASQYDPALGFGKMHPSDGYRSEDLEAQTFADESFDVVITQDVFEHLFAPDRAIKEIARTLKPGGVHVMTVPIVNGSKPSQRRAQRKGKKIVNLSEPQYHGNPVSDEGSLVTVDWGYDIVDYLAAHSGLAVTMYQFDDLSRGLRAVCNEVLVCRKPGKVPAL